MPDPRPLAIYDNVNIYGTPVLGAGQQLPGARPAPRQERQASLTIAPGVVDVRGAAPRSARSSSSAAASSYAVGNACEPIIITSDDAPGTQARGDVRRHRACNGRAKTNVVNSCAGDSAASEGGAIGFYGGNDDNDNSGALRYVRVEYAGKEITPNNELNSFTLERRAARSTHGRLPARRSTAPTTASSGSAARWTSKHLIAHRRHRRRLRLADGHPQPRAVRDRPRRRPQLAPSRHARTATRASRPTTTSSTSTRCSARAARTRPLANCHVRRRQARRRRRSRARRRASTGAAAPAARCSTRSSTTSRPPALKIDDDATWQAHCAAPPAAPARVLRPARGRRAADHLGQRVRGEQRARTRSATTCNFTFTLPRGGPGVGRDLLGGRPSRGDAGAAATMAAGPHSVTWNARSRRRRAACTSTRCSPATSQSTGKITRVD